MTAIYSLQDNTLTEQPAMEKPEKRVGQYRHGSREYYQAIKEWHLYNEHKDKCRTIPCSPECRGLWKEGKVYEEGKDYEVTGATFEGKRHFAATPIPVKSEQGDGDLWKEAAHIMAEKNSPGLARENTIYRQRWTEYHKGLMKLKELGYTLIVKP